MRLEDVLPKLKNGATITRRSYSDGVAIKIASDGVIRFASITNSIADDTSAYCMDWNNDDILAEDWEVVKELTICDCYQEGHWYIPECGTCLGTKEKEPCRCGGNKNRCDFYKNKI